MISVDFDGEEFIINCPAFDNERIKRAPDRKWDNKLKSWRVPATRTGANYLNQSYNNTEKTEKAVDKMRELTKQNQNIEMFPAWFKFKNEPMAHQREALNKTWGLEEMGLFMEMRTGKTFVAINWAACLGMEGKINGAIVVVPNAITLVWEDQLEEHSPIPVHSHVISAGDKKKTKVFLEDMETEGFKVLIVGIEALSQGKAWEYVQKFAMMHKVAMIVDESSRIKNGRSTRTKRVIDIGGLAHYRAILTGTPITQGIEDLFAQFKFLNWKILGFKSEFAFRSRHCTMGGFENRKIIGYEHINEIIDSAKPYVYQCVAAEVMDLPPKIYEERIVEPTKEQARLLKELGDPFKMATNIGDSVLETETVLERMTRYQQIAGGLFPFDDDEGGYEVMKIPGKNPKMEAMIDTLEDLPKGTKVIIWARFRQEVEFIVEHLVATYGESAVSEFHGGVDKDQRKINVHTFQEDDSNLFFVTNQQTGGMGLELSAASAHFYFSNSFSYEERIQSEARTNSKHQKAKSILYVDFRINHKIDKMIARALKVKKSMADYIRGEIGND